MTATNNRDADFSHLFMHPLLRLMPFGAHAPKALVQLELAVRRVVDDEAGIDGRLTALAQLPRLIEDTRLVDRQTQPILEEVARVAASASRSPRLHEKLAVVLLKSEGLRLEGPGQEEDRDVLDRVTLCSVDGRDRVEEPHVSLRVTRVWRDLVLVVGDMPEAELAQLELDDLLATIRCIRALVLFGRFHESLTVSARERRIFCEGVGLGLWERLYGFVKAHPEFDKVMHEHYGRPAQAQVLLHARGATLADKLTPKVAPRQEPRPGHHVVIPGEIPEASTRDDEQALARLAVLQKPLPLPALPSIPEIDRLQHTLDAEFPWAAQAIEELVGDLRARKHFGSVELGGRPTLLVGLPGSGKSRLVRRIAEELKLPCLPMSFAGVSDSRMLLGTARGWSGGQASPIVELLARSRSPTAVVLLDEIDKAGKDTGNCVPPTVSLLGLLEPENARRWLDSYVQAPCDLSKLLFWGTANEIGKLSAALLSRFRVVLVPQPGQEHFAVIAKYAIDDIAEEWGLPRGVLPAVDLGRSEMKPRSAREVLRVVRMLLGRWARENQRYGLH